MKRFTVNITDADIEAALEEARNAPEESLAIAAEYVGGRADVVLVRMSNGVRLAIPREDLQGLQDATEAQLAQIEIWGGTGLSWPQLDVDHYVPALLEHKYGSEKWMEKLRRRGVAA